MGHTLVSIFWFLVAIIMIGSNFLLAGMLLFVRTEKWEAPLGLMIALATIIFYAKLGTGTEYIPEYFWQIAFPAACLFLFFVDLVFGIMILSIYGLGLLPIGISLIFLVEGMRPIVRYAAISFCQYCQTIN